MANETTSLGFNVFARNLASRTFKKIADDADGLAGRLDRAAGTMVKAGAGLSTLTPILSGAVVAAGGLAAPLAAATAGAGALAAVAVPAFTDISEAMALQERAANGSEAAAEQLQDQLADMSPAARKLMKDWQGLTDEYDAWAKSLQPEVLPLFSRGIEMVSGRLDSMNPLVRGSTGAVDNLLTSLDKALRDPFWDQFGDRMTRLAPTAIEGLGRTGGDVAGGVAGIINAFMPAAPGMLRIVEDISAGFRDWGMGLSGSPAFQRFMDYVASSGPQVLAIIRNLGTVMGILLGGLEPFVGLAPLLTGTLSVLSSMLAQVDPVVLESIGTAVGAIVLAWKAWTTAQWALNAAMAANPIGLAILAVVALGAGLVIAWKRSEKFRRVVTETWSKVESGARTVADFFTDRVWPVLVDKWGEFTDAAGPAARQVLGWLGKLRSGSGRFSKIWSTLWDGAARKFGIVWDAIGPIAEDGFEALKGSLRFFTAVLDGDWSTAWDEAKGVLSNGFSAWKRITKTQLKLLKSNLKTWFVELPDAIRDWLDENVPVIKSRLREWGGEFVAWAKGLPARVVPRLVAFGEDIGEWITTDMPPLLKKKVEEWTETFIDWAKGLPDRIVKWLGDAQKVQAALTKWGPRLGVALLAAIAIAVLAIPAAIGLLAAALTVVLFSIGKVIQEQLTEMATGWVRGVSDRLRLGVDEMVGWFTSLPGRILAYFRELYDDLVGHSIVPDTVTDIIAEFNRLPGAAKDIFTRMKNGVIDRAEELRSSVVGKVGSLASGALSALGGFASGAVKAFATAQGGISRAWAKIKGAAANPIRFVISTVYNRGLVPLWNRIADKVDGISSLRAMKLPKGFAAGGIIPGSSSWRGGDTHLRPMREGEGVYVSEAMRDPYERARLYAVNKAAMAGKSLAQFRDSYQVRGISPAQLGQPPLDGFAKGGIVGRALAQGWDAIAGRAQTWAKGPLDSLTASLKGRFGSGSDFGGVPYHMVRQASGKMLARLGRADTAYAKMMAGGGDSWTGLEGASVRLRRAAQFARAQVGKPYIWGGAGPMGYDCSGFTGAIENVIRGLNPHSRRYSTHAFQGATAPAGWVRGLASPYQVGITNAGVGHTAGTLMGVDVESRGSAGVVVGSRARGARNALFRAVYGFAPVAGDATGVKAGAPVFDSGGTLAPGLNTVYNATGRPEPLVRADQEPRTYHITVTVPPTVDKGAVGREVVQAIQAFERDNGSKWRSR